MPLNPLVRATNVRIAWKRARQKKPKRNRNMENKKLKNWKTKQNKRQTDRATRKCCQGDTLTRQHSCSLSLPALPLSLPPSLLSFIYCSFGSCQDLLQDTCDRSVRAAVKDFFMLNTAAVYWWRQQHRKQCDISWSKLAHLFTHTNARTCVCNNNNKWVTKHHKEF